MGKKSSRNFRPKERKEEDDEKPREGGLLVLRICSLVGNGEKEKILRNHRREDPKDLYRK